MNSASNEGRTALVVGGGGFIGGHLAIELIRRGYGHVRVADIKPIHEWQQVHDKAENVVLDACRREDAMMACWGATDVFNLAADMGGMGFIENNKAACMLNVLINTHLLMAAEKCKVQRFFFASSACVYAADKQLEASSPALSEADAYPAMPEDGYGWEKLFSERMCRHFSEDLKLTTRVARFHNIYGPHGTYDGGREKAPAAICRKVATASLRGEGSIDVWGDGSNTRSFTYIDDCITGILKIHDGDFADPINLGSNEQVSVDQLVDIVEDIAQVELERRYLLDAPMGVNGRNSDNTLIESEFQWQPSVPLSIGLERTYSWIKEQISASRRTEATTTEGELWPASSSSTSTIPQT